MAVRPRPVLDRLAHSRSHGVLDDVLAGLHEIALVVDHPRCEAAGEEVPETAMSLVEGLRVAAVQALEPARELRLGRVEDDVVVRRHEAERVDCPPETLCARAQEREEVPAVGVVDEDPAPVDAAREHVEVAVGKARAGNARHPSDEST